MGREQRTGKRKPRSLGTKQQKLGYYIIYTDTQKTEKNYIEGFCKSLPVEFQKKIEIKIEKDSTLNLVNSCREYLRRNPQYRSAWIMLDKDKVANFDEIIQNAREKDIQVAWSNPCIEIWFSGYFGSINCIDSVTCCKNFNILFKNKTQKEYNKGDANIYNILNSYGNEKTAIKYFKTKYTNNTKNRILPSNQIGTSSVFLLIEGIRSLMN